MSDVERLRKELARFTYRPGWTLTIDGSGNLGFGGVTILTVAYEAPDARGPDQPIRVVARRSIPEYAVDPASMDDNYFAFWLQSVLFDVELHESREWLRRDGVLYEDPHKPSRP